MVFSVYNPVINYYIRDYDESFPINTHQDLCDVEDIFNVLDQLSRRKITGNEAGNVLKDLTNLLCFESRHVLKLIIDRDLKVGVSIKTINKVWKNLIPELPYMRCKTFKDVKKIKFPAFAQKKEDAAFFNGVFEDGEFKFFTRNNSEFFPSHLKEEFIHIFHEKDITEDIVIHGELMICDCNGNFLDRQISNGLLSSYIKKDQTLKRISEELEKRIKKNLNFEKLSSKLTEFQNELKATDLNMVAVIWDYVPLKDWRNGKCNIPYIDRFKKLKDLETSHIRVVECEIVENMEEALRFYDKMISQGFEGCVLKNLDGIWQDTDSGSYDQIKMKADKEADLLCVGYVPGEGKYRNGIGSLCFKSCDGLIRVDVPGKSDKMRGFERADKNDSSKGLKLIDGFDCNCYNDCIFPVKFNALIKNENGDYSLFLPRLSQNEPRFDKDYADDFFTIEKM